MLLGGVFVILGIIRYQSCLPSTDQGKIWFYNGQYVKFEGIIIDEPDNRINHTKLIISVKKLLVGDKRSSIVGKALVIVGLYPEYKYGDSILVSCRLESPEPIEGFAYDRYLAKIDIYSQCSYPQVKLINHDNGSWFLNLIFAFKGHLKSMINSNLPEPQASLFSAIILGAKRGVPSELADKFSITGTSHLIAISGLHITLLASILMQLALAGRVRRKKAFWLVSLAILLYIIMIGFPPSAVRAGLMSWLFLFATQIGRKSQSTNSLIFSASIMILINPKILRDDVGFQLSFCAVLGLIYFLPLIEAWLEKIPSVFGIKESLQMSLSAQFTTLPLIIYNFGRLSLVSSIVNLLVLPSLPYLMIIGFGAIFLSLLVPAFAQYLFFPVWILLTYLIKAVEIFALIPLAAISL